MSRQAIALLLLGGLAHGAQKVEGHWEDDGGVLLRGDAGQGLQVAQLKSRPRLVDDVGRLLQRHRGLLLSLGSHHLGTSFPVRLRLSSHCPLHLPWQQHVLHLNHLNPDAPGVRGVVKDVLHHPGHLLLLLQDLHEGLGAHHVPQGGRCQQLGGFGITLHIADGGHGILNVVVDDGVDADGDAVAGEDLLGGDVEGDGPEVDHRDGVDAGEDEEEAGTNHPASLHSEAQNAIALELSQFSASPAEPEDDGTLVLLDSLEAEPDGDGEGDCHQDDGKHLAK